MFIMAELQTRMYSVHLHQDSKMGFHLGSCLGIVHENVPSNQLSYCDLAEIYYLFFPIQVNAHTSPSIYSFIADFGPVSFGFLLFHSFLRRPLYWQLEPFGVFFLSGQKKLNNSLWGWCWYHFLQWHLQTCLSDQEHFRFVSVHRLQGKK